MYDASARFGTAFEISTIEYLEHQYLICYPDNAEPPWLVLLRNASENLQKIHIFNFFFSNINYQTEFDKNMMISVIIQYNVVNNSIITFGKSANERSYSSCCPARFRFLIFF